MFLHILTLEYTVKNWVPYMFASILIMSCEGAYVTLQAVITMQQFGLKRGPQVYAFQLSAQAMASILISLFVTTLKPMGGYKCIFIICFIGLICASICTYLIDEKKQVKYGELYYDDIGMFRSNRNSKNTN